MSLCEYVCDIAKEEAQKRLYKSFVKLSEEIADEIIELAEEYEPKANH